MHVPLWLQGCLNIVLGENHILGDSADTISAIADGLLLPCRHRATITPNGPSIVRAGVGTGFKSRWRSKVKTSKGSRFTEEMTGGLLGLQRLSWCTGNLRARHHSEIIK